MSEKTKKLNDSSVVRVTTAAASSLLPIVDSTSGTTAVIEYQKLKAQLRADLLNDMQIGGMGGQIASFTAFPNYDRLCALGYTTEANKNSDASYFKGLLCWIVDNGLVGRNLIGKVNPNSQGLFLFSSADSTSNNLPAYSSGVYLTYSSQSIKEIKVGTYKGTFIIEV